ncbi:DUF4062 domain-containing protein [Paraburkholderia sp. BR13439]|uniref:DUF4062 domain-containing protein n=1 Tax=Paraburkholderia sp. BR13439 TaxID=3236996 RepID=UPI0034CD2464
MDKKYQVFISSTYTDMRVERQAAVEAILDAGHIPAGMELFAASDKAQMDVIKGWIDESDLFVLILGGRYGSVEPESGKSYIQLEYEYAVSSGKPFFALYLTDSFIQEKTKGPLGLDAIERSDTKKLNEFRALVKSKLCSEIHDVKDVHIQIPKSIRSLSATRNLGGWVRASSVPDLGALLQEMTDLREQNTKLKQSQKASSVNVLSADDFDGAPTIDLEIPLTLTYSYGEFDNAELETYHYEDEWEGTYSEIFVRIAPKILQEPIETVVGRYVDAAISEVVGKQKAEVADGDFQKLKIKLVKMGLINLRNSSRGLHWCLTDAGKAILVASV